MEIEEIIRKTADEVVLKLKMAGLMKDENKSVQEKTEDLLRNYNAFGLSGDPDAEKMLMQIESGLQIIKDDIYYDVIPMYYIEHKTREEIAEAFDTSVTTISRNKTRLIKKISAVLFSGDYIRQLYC